MSKLTVIELINRLREFPDNAEVLFQQGLTISNITERSGSEIDQIANIEFNEIFNVASDD